MPTEEQVISVLKEIIDPHTNVNLYDMGLISDISVSDDSISVTFRPTSPFCPLGVHFALNIKRRLEELDGAGKISVNVVGHAQQDAINQELSGS